MSSFAINGVIQAAYEYNYQGHQVVRRLTQLGQTIHNIFDADGQRIAEYLYDDTTGTSSQWHFPKVMHHKSPAGPRPLGPFVARYQFGYSESAEIREYIWANGALVGW